MTAPRQNTQRLGANRGIAMQVSGFLLAWTTRTLVVGHLTMPSPPRLGLAAILLLCAASLILWARRSLGAQWSIQARMLPEHHLITTGPYGIVRHPIYLGGGLFLVAVGLVAATWWAFLVAIALYARGALLRIRAEERLLSDRFGVAFESYRKRVPALVPRLPFA